jgi:hypothetical protein
MAHAVQPDPPRPSTAPGRGSVSMLGYVGRAIRASLVNGSTREGFVYAVDPENGSAVMLVKAVCTTESGPHVLLFAHDSFLSTTVSCV